MEPSENPLNVGKILWPVLAIAQITFIVLPPKQILYSETIYLPWTFVIVILLGLPYSVYKAIDAYDQNGKLENFKMITFLLPIAGGISFGIFHSNKEITELKEKGRWTKGVVSDSKMSRGYWMIEVRYVVDNKEYVTSFEDEPHQTLEDGDSVKLIYSSETPIIYRLGYEWDEIKK